MRILINNIGFDIDPQTDFLDNIPRDHNVVTHFSRELVASWKCPNGPIRTHVRVGANNEWKPPLIVVFHEGAPLSNTPVADKIKSERMKAKTLKRLQMRNISDIQTALHRVLGKASVNLDLDAFSWMNPYAAYLVFARVEVQYFVLTNLAKGLRFFVGVPHSVRLWAEPQSFCNATAYEGELGEDKPLADHPSGLTDGHTKAGRALRRRFLRDRLRGLPTTPPVMEWAQRERERLETELMNLDIYEDTVEGGGD